MKKFISLVLIMSLVAANAVFAVGPEESGYEGYDDGYGFAQSTGMEFTGEEIRLSLEDAITRMMTQGAPIEQANLMRTADRLRTRSSFDNASALTALRNAPAGALGMGEGRPSRTREEMAIHAHRFARAQTDRNYEAALNLIMRNVVLQYHSLAHAQENLRISLENVEAQERLHRNAVSRFELGVASRMEVLMAELAVNQAVTDAERNEVAYFNARMSFNIAFGFDLMQNVVITDALSQAPASQLSLEDAIESALADRNEIHDAAFTVEHFELARREARNNVSIQSPTYRDLRIAHLTAQNTYANMPKNIEMEVRSRYLDMRQRKSELELGRMNVENAREAFRLANLQYEVGMTTLAETHSALLSLYNAQLFYNMALLQYNLAVTDYELSATVGTVTVRF